VCVCVCVCVCGPHVTSVDAGVGLRCAQVVAISFAVTLLVCICV